MWRAAQHSGKEPEVHPLPMVSALCRGIPWRVHARNRLGMPGEGRPMCTLLVNKDIMSETCLPCYSGNLMRKTKSVHDCRS